MRTNLKLAVLAVQQVTTIILPDATVLKKKIKLKKYWPSNIFDVPIIAQFARNAQQEEARLPIVQWVKRPVCDHYITLEAKAGVLAALK